MGPCPFNDDEMLHFCQEANVRHLRSEDGCGRKVVQISPDLVVKFGLGVMLQEAHTQQFAFQVLNQAIVQIPQVHRFFTRHHSAFGSVGYLVMDNVEGVNLEHIDWEQLGLISHASLPL